MNNIFTPTPSLRCVLLLLALPFLPLAADGQSVTGYNAQVIAGTNSASYTPLKPTITTPAVRTGGDEDEGYYNQLPIGFTFNFAGTNYTTFSASTNGWMTFGQALTDAGITNDLRAHPVRPIVAPFWDDISFGPAGTASTDGNLFVETTGTPGSQICTIEWRNIRWNALATGPALSFLVRLMEGTNVVEFAYAQGSGSASGSRSASTGIGGMAMLDFISAATLSSGSSAGFSTTTETTSLSSRPSTGRRLSFTPGALATRSAEALTTFQLAPNPAAAEVRLVGHDARQPVQLFDGQGKLVRTCTLATDVLDLRGLARGLYLVRIGQGSCRLVVE